MMRLVAGFAIPNNGACRRSVKFVLQYAASSRTDAVLQGEGSTAGLGGPRPLPHGAGRSPACRSRAGSAR